MIGMRDIAYMLKYFDARFDSEFSDKNVVFIPQSWILKSIKADKDNFQF